MYKTDNILEIKNISKCYKNFNNESNFACSDISLNVERGKTLGIVGESGSGKTTLVRMLMNIEKPSGGEVFYYPTKENEFGAKVDLTKLEKKDIRKIRQKIQMVFQNPWETFNPKMKVKDIVLEPLLNYKVINKFNKEIAIKLLKMVDLNENLLDRKPKELSGGQLQRLSIARALSLKPDILICDESTCSLDASIEKDIVELLVKLQKEYGLTIIFICHDVALISLFAHKIAIMKESKLVEVITHDDLINNKCTSYTKKLVDSIFKI